MKLNLLLTTGMIALCTHSFAQAPAGGNRAAGAAANGARSTTAVSIESATQGMKKFEGYFNFYYDEKTGKVLLEVDKFDKEFLYFTSLTDGAGRAAERGQANANIAKFVKVGPKVMLVEPVYSYRAVTTNVDEIHAVDNAFAKSVIWGFTPVAVEGEKALIDITPFIIRDSQNIGGRLGAGGATGGRGGAGGRGTAAPAAGGGAFRVDETRSAVYLPTTKNFPKNTEFEALVTFAGAGNSDGALTRRSVAPSGRSFPAPCPWQARR